MVPVVISTELSMKLSSPFSTSPVPSCARAVTASLPPAEYRFTSASLASGTEKVT